MQYLDVLNHKRYLDVLNRLIGLESAMRFGSPKWYELESRLCLIVAYRTLGNSDGSLKDQYSSVALGYFPDLYRQLGICKVSDEQMIGIFSQYQKFSSFNWIESYFMDVYGYHWFDTDDENDFLELADEIMAERDDLKDRSQIEECLLDDFTESRMQKDGVTIELDRLMQRYKLECTTLMENELVVGLGFAFYMSDIDDEPQTNLYLYRSRLLYHLWKMDHPSITYLFSFLSSSTTWIDADQETFCFAFIQDYINDEWCFTPSMLYALCALTAIANQMAEQDPVLKKAAEQDAVWYRECQEEKKNCP